MIIGFPCIPRASQGTLSNCNSFFVFKERHVQNVKLTQRKGSINIHSSIRTLVRTEWSWCKVLSLGRILFFFVYYDGVLERKKQSTVRARASNEHEKKTKKPFTLTVKGKIHYPSISIYTTERTGKMMFHSLKCKCKVGPRNHGASGSDSLPFRPP